MRKLSISFNNFSKHVLFKIAFIIVKYAILKYLKFFVKIFNILPHLGIEKYFVFIFNHVNFYYEVRTH